jgi:hypothetical protein
MKNSGGDEFKYDIFVILKELLWEREAGWRNYPKNVCTCE